MEVLLLVITDRATKLKLEFYHSPVFLTEIDVEQFRSLYNRAFMQALSKAKSDYYDYENSETL
jgi:hypothetical protein